MTTEIIIKKYLDEMHDEFPHWEIPEEHAMYCFSINQVRNMMLDKEKETIEEVEKMINEISESPYYLKWGCDSYRIALEYLGQELSKLQEKKWKNVNIIRSANGIINWVVIVIPILMLETITGLVNLVDVTVGVDYDMS